MSTSSKYLGYSLFMGRGDRGDKATAAPRRAGDAFAATIIKVMFPKGEERPDHFTIAKARNENTGEEIVLKGGYGPVCDGQLLQIEQGAMRHDARFGDFYQVWKVSHEDPVTREAIEHYLEGLPGVGEKMAAAIVDQHGLDCLSKIDQDPNLLLSLRGISTSKLEEIMPVWEDLRAERKTRLYLSSLGLGDSSSSKVIDHFGASAKSILENDPYQLTRVPTIGFRQADLLAQKLGSSSNDPRRLAAGVEFLLEQGESDGHICLTKEQMFALAPTLLTRDGLRPSPEQLDFALQSMQDEGQVWCETDPGDGIKRYYTRELWTVETRLLEQLDERLSAAKIRPPSFFKKPDDSKLTDEQWGAAENAFTEKLSILTGNPGTGKTSTLVGVIEALEKEGQSCTLLAPTGKAAKRMEEATGREASTIHRRLGFSGGEAPRSFKGSQDEIIDTDVVIVDEASMMDLRLSERLLSHLGKETRLILVGDRDQLPPVGAGSVLYDLIESERVPTTKLTKIFRQAENSLLTVNAHRICQGQDPYWTKEEATAALGHPVRDDFGFIETDNADEAMKLTMKEVKKLQKELSVRPEDVLVTAPSRKGSCGIYTLNQALAKKQNPNGEEIRGGDMPLRLGDRVMNTKNRYSKEGDIFNGDTGKILAYDKSRRRLEVDFGDDKPAVFHGDEIEGLIPAYAATTHRLQGSEAAAVITPIVAGSGSRLHSRNLIYTAITRGKEKAVIIGSKKTIREAIARDGSSRNTTLDLRASRIAPRLKARWEQVRRHSSAQELLYGRPTKQSSDD